MSFVNRFMKQGILKCRHFVVMTSLWAYEKYTECAETSVEEKKKKILYSSGFACENVCVRVVFSVFLHGTFAK